MKFSKFISDAASGVTGLTSASGGTAIADNKLVRGDGATGIQGSGIDVSDADVITGVAGLTVDSFDFDGKNLTVTGNMNILPSGDVSVGTGNLRTEIGWMISPKAFKVKAADQTVTNSSTLVNDTELTVDLVAGETYQFRFHLYATVNTTSGIKVALGGTSTHTDLISDIRLFDVATFLYAGAVKTISTTVANHQLIGDPGLGSTITGTGVIVEINGTTTVNAAGTFLVQFAQGGETGAAETAVLNRGSILEVWNVVPTLGED